jgi:hypothetical protein
MLKRGISCVKRGRYKITNNNRLKNNLKEKEKLVAGPKWAPDIKTDWPTDCRSQCDFDFDFELCHFAPAMS